MFLILFIMIPILFSLLGYLFHQKIIRLFLLLTTCSVFVMSIFLFFYVRNHGEYIEYLGGYANWQGINLIADEVSVLFIMLTTFLFMVLYIYNYQKKYMNGLFLFLFLLLEGLINGIFLVGDLFSVYALIEVSTVCVAILIMFKKNKQSIYDGMLYMLINIVAMNFYLFGVAYIYKIFGTLNMSLIHSSIPLVSNVKTLVLPYGLLITAVGLKAAVMPLFSWLPKAHGTPSAPSVVSAALSGLYVKCGLYMLIRINAIFNPTIDVSTVFVLLGFMTGFIGFMLALSQTDIKLILAYHTVSQIGFIIFGLYINSHYSYYGAIYHIINHAVFKSALFLTAGIIYEEYGTRNIKKIRGVFKRMPYVSIITIVSIFGITGAPLFNGSVSKYLIGKGAVEVGIYEIAFFILNMGTILSFVKYSSMFFGESEKKAEVSKSQIISLTIFGLITFLGGVFGEQVVEFLFDLPVKIKVAAMVKKFILYSINIGFGVIIYRYIYPKITFFKKIREFEICFNEIVASIVVFFILFTSYVYMVC